MSILRSVWIQNLKATSSTATNKHALIQWNSQCLSDTYFWNNWQRVRGAADVGMQPTVSTVSTTSSTSDMPDTKDFRIPTSVIAPPPLVSSSTCSPPGTASGSSTMRPPPPPPPPKSRSNGSISGSEVKTERTHHEEPSSSIPDLGKSSLWLFSSVVQPFSYYASRTLRFRLLLVSLNIWHHCCRCKAGQVAAGTLFLFFSPCYCLHVVLPAI